MRAPHANHAGSMRRRLIAAAGFLCLVFALLAAYRVAVVHGDSMLPTFRDGQMVLVSRLGGEPKRGEVVLVRVPSNEVLIKRVFKLPGETLSAREAEWFHKVTEYLEPTGRPEAPVRVPKGFLLVLGDNQRISDDSRTFGTIPLSDVIGRVVNAPPKQLIETRAAEPLHRVRPRARKPEAAYRSTRGRTTSSRTTESTQARSST